MRTGRKWALGALCLAAAVLLAGVLWWVGGTGARRPMLSLTLAGDPAPVPAHIDPLDAAPVFDLPAGRPATLLVRAWRLPWESPPRVEVVLDGATLLPAGGARHAVRRRVPPLAPGEHRGTVLLYGPDGRPRSTTGFRIRARMKAEG